MNLLITLRNGLSYPVVHRSLAVLFFLIALPTVLLLTRRLAPRRRFWIVVPLIAFFGCLALLTARGPNHSTDDPAVTAATLHVTLQSPRQIGPFLFPAGTTLHYWTEGWSIHQIAALDAADLPRPTLLAGVPLQGHLELFHAVTGLTGTLASDANISGLPCRRGLVLLYPETARLLSCTLQQPQTVQGWSCTDVELSPEGDLRTCRTAAPTQLPVGRFPSGIGLNLSHGAVERLSLNRGQQFTLFDPPLHWFAGSRMEISLASPATIASVATLYQEELPFRGAYVHGLIEWIYPPVPSQSSPATPARPLALKASLHRPLLCRDGDLLPGTLVELPLAGDTVTALGPENPEPGTQPAPTQHTCSLLADSQTP